VREITRVANTVTEDYLLMIAEHGTAAHVEKLVRAYRRCQEAEELSREARQQQSRSVMYRYDDDGSLIMNVRLPAEAGALVLKALELAVENVPAGTSEERIPFSARRRGRFRRRCGVSSMPATRVVAFPAAATVVISMHITSSTGPMVERRSLATSCHSAGSIIAPFMKAVSGSRSSMMER
jgi:hypothetical protein